MLPEAAGKYKHIYTISYEESNPVYCKEIARKTHEIQSSASRRDP